MPQPLQALPALLTPPLELPPVLEPPLELPPLLDPPLEEPELEPPLEEPELEPPLEEPELEPLLLEPLTLELLAPLLLDEPLRATHCLLVQTAVSLQQSLATLHGQGGVWASLQTHFLAPPSQPAQ